MQLRASAKERTNLNSIEFEKTLWTARMREYRFPEADITNEGFGPKSGRVADLDPLPPGSLPL